MTDPETLKVLKFEVWKSESLKLGKCESLKLLLETMCENFKFSNFDTSNFQIQSLKPASNYCGPQIQALKVWRGWKFEILGTIQLLNNPTTQKPNNPTTQQPSNPRTQQPNNPQPNNLTTQQPNNQATKPTTQQPNNQEQNNPK